MNNLMYKELTLSASKLSFLFIAFGLMTFLPGYPVLVGAFFVSFGIFHSFQTARENSDIIYSALLPVGKSDVVKGKFTFCIFIELCGFILMTAVTLIRMTVLRDVSVYRNNALMNANLVFLGFALLIFGCFNFVFVRGFFKSAYYFGKPFVAFIITAFLIIGAGESLHHIPGLEAVNSFGFEKAGLQLAFLISGILLYILLTAVAVKKSVQSFERIDL